MVVPNTVKSPPTVALPVVVKVPPIVVLPVELIFLNPDISAFESTTTALLASTAPSVEMSILFKSVAVPVYPSNLFNSVIVDVKSTEADVNVLKFTLSNEAC